MKRSNVVIAASLGVAGVSVVAGAVAQQYMQTQGMRANGLLGNLLLTLLPQLGSWGGIIAAIWAAISKINLPASTTTVVDPVKPTDNPLATEIELVMAVLEWAKDRKNIERIQRVVLALVQEIRVRFGSNPEVVAAAGNLAAVMVKANYVDLPTQPESAVSSSGK